MKLGKLIFIGFVGLLSIDTIAQVESTKFNPIDIKPVDQDDIWSVDFAPVIWLQNSVAPSARKFSYSTGLAYHYEFNFSHEKRFSIALGLGYHFTQLNHGGLFFNDSTNQTSWSRPLPTDDFNFSRLNLHRINLSLEFRVKTKKEFKVYFGYQSSFIVASKNKSKVNGEEASFTNFESLQVFQYGPRLRIGYKDVFLYSNFYLSSLFKNRSSLSMQLVEFGISLGG